MEKMDIHLKKLNCSLGTDELICIINANLYIIELEWLEHVWNHENMFETGVVQANEC